MGSTVSPPLTRLALNLIEALKEHLAEEPLVFAAPEEADYFRKTAKRKKETPPPSVAPPPAPLPKPIAVAPPPPAPVIQKPIAPPPAPIVEESPAPLPPKQHPISPPQSHSLKALFAKIAPDLLVLDEIPSDAWAKKVAHRWKTKNQTAPLSILYSGEPPEQKALLEEIARALDVYFGPARLVAAEQIEKEKQWEAFLSVPELKMVFACDYTLWQLGDLMRHYKEMPTQGSRTLGKVPLFLLPDMSLYLKDPLLKRSLWKALCQKLSS